MEADVLDRLSKIEGVLTSVRSRIPDMVGLAIVTRDGLPIASSITSVTVDEDRISAMTAASLNLAERVLMELGRGEMVELMIKGEHGFVIIMNSGEEACITGITQENAKLGLILLDMHRAAKKLSELL